MKNIRYRLIDDRKKVIFCNLKNQDIDILDSLSINSKKINDGTTRVGKLIDENKNCIYAFANEKIYIQSTKKFNTVLHALLSSINYIKDSIQLHNQAINRLLHNLITLNAQNVQELDVLFPQMILVEKLIKGKYHI